jgi:ElaA protein
MEILQKDFSDLSTLELFKIYQLRALVFVVEQNCAYLDVDDTDLTSKHVLFLEGELLVAYARIIPASPKMAAAKIGRVVVHPEFRRRDLGRSLMKYCIHSALQVSENKEIAISAQSYLLQFYTELGFKVEGEPYLEDNIPHCAMRYSAGEL